MSQVREMGKLVYEQPGNEVDGSCHSKEGSKYISREGLERGAKGNQQGEKEARGMCRVHMNHVLVCVLNGMLVVIE